jgi:hypothetical protein
MMEKSMENRLYPKEESATNEELQSVKDIVASLLIAMKNYGLYPEGHAICQKSIANFGTHLDSFLNGHDCLRFEVQKDRLIFRNEVVHQDLSGGNHLAFPLFRDGIQWLEFQKGIVPSEITGLVTTINKYKDLHEEAEGDIVTALWESEFPNLQWKATDVHWESEPMLDLSLLSVGEVEQHGMEESTEEQDSPVTTGLQTTELGLLKLTAEEMENLRRMILDEEKRDNAQDLLDVMLILLNDQYEEKDLTATLEFMADEFQDTLAQGEFRFGFKLLTELRAIRSTCKKDRPWAVVLLDHFFMKISSPRILGVLSQVLPSLDELDSDRMKLLQQCLVLLPSEAILALGPMILEMRSSGMQQQLMKIIGIMAKKDLRPLEQLLDSPDEVMVQKLVYILGHLEGERPAELLLQMVRHYSARVRRQAIRQLMVKDEQMLRKLFSLIEDPDASIRRLMLKQLGEARDESAERLLLDYLEQRQFGSTDHQHILACYSTLGRCGSQRSIPFLRRTLFDRGWIFGNRRSIHRRGAAIALSALDTEEAKDILHKASRSLSPTVRFAYRKALGAIQ